MNHDSRFAVKRTRLFPRVVFLPAARQLVWSSRPTPPSTPHPYLSPQNDPRVLPTPTNSENGGRRDCTVTRLPPPRPERGRIRHAP
jgi:hypothetical protein